MSRKNWGGKKMVKKHLYLPQDLYDKVDRYAGIRGISRNVAFAELVNVAFYGEEKVSQLPVKEALEGLR